MFIKAKSIAFKAAIVTFLVLSIVCQLRNIDAIICLKRAMLGSIAAYIICKIMVKALNSLLLNAVINKRLSEEMKNRNADQN